MISKGHFYYLNDKYFVDFSDDFLMQNKEAIDGKLHDRPCFFAFEDSSTGLFWMIPISSRVEKFKKLYNSKIQKYGKCDTISFGDVLGHEKAFLIQNMCPVTADYINNEYLDKKTNMPVQVNGVLEKELITKAKRVLALHRKGIKLIFPDILKIESELLK